MGNFEICDKLMTYEKIVIKKEPSVTGMLIKLIGLSIVFSFVLGVGGYFGVVTANNWHAVYQSTVSDE